jgi:hypothetical protein
LNLSKNKNEFISLLGKICAGWDDMDMGFVHNCIIAKQSFNFHQHYERFGCGGDSFFKDVNVLLSFQKVLYLF